MNDEPAPTGSHDRPKIYEIRVEGHLDGRWANRLGDLTITWEEGGNTLLTGEVIDQSALYGLLRKLRDCGLPLLSVVCMDSQDATA